MQEKCSDFVLLVDGLVQSMPSTPAEQSTADGQMGKTMKRSAVKRAAERAVAVVLGYEPEPDENLTLTTDNALEFRHLLEKWCVELWGPMRVNTVQARQRGGRAHAFREAPGQRERHFRSLLHNS